MSNIESGSRDVHGCRVFKIHHGSDRFFKNSSWQRHVRYLRSRFEYVWNGFVPELVPSKPMMVPDRSRRELSIAHFIFLHRPPFVEKNPNHYQKTALKSENFK